VDPVCFQTISPYRQNGFGNVLGGWNAEARSFGPALPFGSEKAVTKIQAVRHWEEQDEQASSAKHKQWLEQFAVVER
jgi:hypothetical protein